MSTLFNRPTDQAEATHPVRRVAFRGLRTALYVATAFIVGAVVTRNATVQEFAGQKYDAALNKAPDVVSDRLPKREPVGASA
jgi:hypothetical protein